MSTIRISKVYDLSSSSLGVQQFTVSYTVTAHLVYSSAISKAELNNITINESGGDIESLTSTFSASSFASEINNTLLDSNSDNSIGF